MEPIDTPLTEQIIKNDFEELGFDLDTMIEIIQPQFNLNQLGAACIGNCSCIRRWFAFKASPPLSRSTVAAKT